MSQSLTPGTREHFSRFVHRAVTTPVSLADEAQFLADVNGASADSINTSGFGPLFGRLQLILADEMVLQVTKLFDASRKYTTLGIDLEKQGHDSSELQPLDDTALTKVFVLHYRAALPTADAHSVDPRSAALGALRFRRDVHAYQTCRRNGGSTASSFAKSECASNVIPSSTTLTLRCIFSRRKRSLPFGRQ